MSGQGMQITFINLEMVIWKSVKQNCNDKKSMVEVICPNPN